ncbi:hypothetical protein BTE77_28355 [Ensifer adhaerens]|nr:hypothetical protein BTE77_28355 [Ensifer adhaerens]
MAESIRFSPDILARLGEELVSDSDQGIMELVKNAYDADATVCTIELANIHSDSGSITVSDDGTGMSSAGIRDGWLVIGKSSKTRKTLTTVYNRVPAGDKGLGRLAALRLGKSVSLVTRPIDEPGVEYRLKIDWGRFDAASLVEEVELDVEEFSTAKSHGTEITIELVKPSFNRTSVNKLARNLLLLSDPFARAQLTPEPIAFIQKPLDEEAGAPKDPGFRAKLMSAEYADLQAKVAQAYYGDAEYRISVSHGSKTSTTFRIVDWKGDILHENVSAPTADAPLYDTQTFEFDLWVFILDSKTFSTRASTVSEVREWLNQVGGVHVYEDGIRVPPYGGPGDDWLEINLRRARSPEMRPSTNTSVGLVRLSNLKRSLVQKTDRSGYIENTPFSEMKRCCQDALDWAARALTRERDKVRQVEKQVSQQKTERATENLDKVLAHTVSTVDRKKVDDAIALFVKETDREARSLREELQLYRSLATAGMTSAVFAHEIGRPLELIDKGIEALKRLIPDEKREMANKRISRISNAKLRLNSFMSIPLTLLTKKKRRSGRVNINNCIIAMSELLLPITEYFNVTTELELTDGYNDINGSEALIDGIFLNLVMNSINAFQRDSFEQPDRRIKISTRYDGSNIVLTVDDNAGGIDGIDLRDIWLPGVTTSANGTGFGLTIVRDSLGDLGGTVDAVTLTDFGGAQFNIRLPPMRGLF